MLRIAFLHQPSNFVSRPTSILSWLLRVSLTCVARCGVNTAIKHLRKQCAVRGFMFLIYCPEDRKTVKLRGQQNCYNLLEWSDVNSLAVNIQRNLIKNLAR